MLQAAPAIERIMINSDANVALGGAVLQSISAALHHGASRNLDGFESYGCTVEEEDVKDFMDVLEKSETFALFLGTLWVIWADFKGALRDQGMMMRILPRGPDKKALYFFIVSNNLTLPSWAPLLNADEQDMARYNLECGVLMLERNPANPSLFSEELMLYVNESMKSSDTTTLSRATCQFDREAITERQELLVGEISQCRRDGNVCARAYMTTISNGDRLKNAKECLKNGYLKGLLGSYNLFHSEIFKKSFFVRWALYDYLFNDLARQLPVERLGAYDVSTTRKYFLKEITEYPGNHPWIMCQSAPVTLDVLVDIFTRFSIAFDMYDSRINSSRPVVSQETLVTLDEATCNERIVEDYGQKSRTDCTPYDTLSFLMQSMHSAIPVWWTCPRGHSFYYSPHNMLMRNAKSK